MLRNILSRVFDIFERTVIFLKNNFQWQDVSCLGGTYLDYTTCKFTETCSLKVLVSTGQKGQNAEMKPGDGAVLVRACWA